MQERFKFGKNQMIYHVTPESSKGIIINRRYYPDTDECEYLVSYGYGTSAWCDEEELTDKRTLDI